MAIINLRDYYPHYELDCPVEVADSDVEEFTASLTEETAALYFNDQRKENAYQRRQFFNKAHYSLDQEDGIEGNNVHRLADPLFEGFVEKLTQQQLQKAIASLPEAQSRRINAHFYLGMSKSAIARAENVKESAVRNAIKRGLINLEKIAKKFF
jgi:RNA polymerase sigma-70 factor (ECF subfamily)